MRLLFISNLYPPDSIGGYEQWCQEVAEELATRGHDLCVLTSRAVKKEDAIPESNPLVQRILNLEVEGGLGETVWRLLKKRQRLEDENLQNVRKVVADFSPDAVMIWGMWNVPRSVPALLEELLPDQVVYFFCDYWPSLKSAYLQRWQEPSRSRLSQLPKSILGAYFRPQLQRELLPALQFARPICVSQAVRDLLVQASVPVEHATIIYGGTQVKEFVSASADRTVVEEHLRLVYVGRIVADKGVHTAIDAVKRASQETPTRITLDIYGSGDPAYETRLLEFVREYRLEKVVRFCGRVPRHEIPHIFSKYDSFIFSSEWEEPFARSVLEAMAAGLVVIGTTTGGTKEILHDGEVGLTYKAGDVQSLTEQILRLADDSALQRHLSKQGQQCVVEQYQFSHMVDQFEKFLLELPK